MSFVAFGLILHRANINEQEREDLAWSVFKKGVNNHVYVMLDNNIYFTDLGEMLSLHGIIKKPNIKYLRYLLTSSPMENTSEELVGPIYDDDGLVQRVATNFRKVSNWINSVINHENVEKVYLYVVEGFDISFEEIKTDRDGIYEGLLSQIGFYGDIPSLVMEIK